MTCPHRHDAAAYVLGALDPADRVAFETHLPGCAACAASVRGLTELPGVLAHVPVEEVLAEPVEPPREILTGLVARVRAERRRRRVRTAFVTAAAVVAVAVGGVVAANALQPATGPEPPPPATATAVSAEFTSVGGIDVWGFAELTAYPEGTRITLTCRYSSDLPYIGDLPYRLVITNGNGDTEVAGSWHSAKGGHSTAVTLFTRWNAENITAMEIQDLDGNPILRWRA